MEKDLEKYLKLLNSERCLKKPKEAIIILDKISKCFTNESSQFTLGILVGLVLDENEAIFSFIWKTSSTFETVPCVSAAFKLLEYLVTDFQKCTEPYFPILYQKCLYLLDGKFAKVKELSLKLIKNVVDADSKHSLDLLKLVFKLEKCLREENKIAGTVTDQIYSLFGYLFEKSPESVKEEKWLFHKMFESLKRESTVAKNPSLGIVNGALEGIKGYLVNYSPTDAETMKKTYEYIKKWSKYREDKKAVSRASLNLLQTHWRHFSSFMFKDREFWKINLDVWINQKSEDRQIAFRFLCSFYSVIALCAKKESNNSEIKNCIKEFIKCLESNSNVCERKAALVGIKLFVLTDCLTADDFNEIYERAMNFIKKEETYKSLTYVPLCIECLSAFVLKFPNESFHMEQLTLLQRLSVRLIESYPTFEAEFQSNALIALEKSFYMMGLSNQQTTDNHIDTVLYQGLIRTCSSITLAELELLVETGQDSDSVCYKSFVGLWKYLLTLTRSPNLPVGGSFALKKGVAVKVFDAFVLSFLKIISKLDFSIGSEMEVQNPSDLHIFINIVDLYQDLLAVVDSFSLQKWLVELFRTVIHLSYRNPLLSGFYKITAVNLKLADRTHFFDDCSTKKCFELVEKFLADILTKVDHYKGELQVACVKVLLAAPIKVIENLVEKAVPALEIITQLSRNCFPLLKDLIETLERWDLHLPSATSERIMMKVLPLLDVFFQSPYFRGKNSVDSSKGGKKLKVEVVFNDSELLELQKKFLMFLGNLEIRKGLNLIELPDTEERRKISDKHLVYSLPCGKGWVEMDLDEIILRVADLAESCGDRRTRIAACELLYSMVLLIVGNINQLSGGYTYLFRKVVRTCLVLGCDSDGLVCQIFEPLMYQIIHYFSGKQAVHFSETEDLIDILMDCVTCPCNPSVRDFSGDLLREFSVWSIKHLSPEELKTTPESTKRILQKIYSLALHPSYSKRLGAAVIFNKIYSVLREEDFILNSYWFQLFYYFMESLRMCDDLEEVTEIVEAIRHLERPLVEKRKEFNKDSSSRVVPPDFEGGRLCHLVRWTLERACDVKPPVRRTAMSLVQKLAPLVENCDTNMSFTSKQLQNFFQLKVNSFQSDFNEADYTKWLKYQWAGLEHCTWLLEESVLTIEEVFQPKFKAVLKRFISGVMTHGESKADNQREAILAFLKLLRSLKERVCLFPPEHWDLLKMITFKPSKFGFDLDQSSTADELLSVLIDLLNYFSNHLPEYDWDTFFRNMETVITAPVFGQITANKQVSAESLEFLFSLKVIEGSGVWSAFKKKVFFSMNEDLFVTPIFKSLFLNRGKTEYALTLEPSCKLYLEEVLRIMLTVSTDLKGLMKCLESEEEVREEETGKAIKKGEFFISLFKNPIFTFLSSKHDQLLEWVLRQSTTNGLKLLACVLNHQSVDPDLPLEVFVRWQDFENLNITKATLKNKLLFQVAVSSARIIGTPGFLKTSPVADRIYAILENQKLEEMDFSEIETICNLLPFLSVFKESIDENDRLRACLSKIHVDVTALKESGEVFKQNHVEFALNGILHSLKATASLVVLDFIMSRASWFNSICKKSEVESALGVFGESRVSVEHSVSALQLACDHCFGQERTEITPSVIYKLFLDPLLRVAPNPAVYEFMMNNLENLSRLVSTYWGEDKSSMEILTNMAKKISAAGIFQTFIAKLSKEELDQMPKERRQMIDTTVKSVFFFLKKPYPPRVLKERYRKLMCEIFNMICCIVSARCTDEKFYRLFIFDDRGSFLFEAIDKNETYNLDMDFDEIPKRKKHLTILREAIAPPTFGRDSAKYIQTNTLFTSSLQEEVTRFDLTFSFIRPVDSVSQTTKNVEIELEMDSLNSHECMATLVATISKMVRDKITPVDDVTELPCWLKFFLSILGNSDLSENLRLFVLKAVYNVQEFLAGFCRQIFPDLLDAMLKLFINYPINYFLMDLIEMMVGWKHVPENERSRLQLTELMEIVLEKSDSLRRDIVKYNLEILKIMIEVWKSGMHLPQLSLTVFKRLSKSVEEDLKAGTNADSVTYLNIHTCGILLSNEIPAWKDGCEEQFFDLILKGFREENRHNQLFGEVCGQALKYVARTKPSVLGVYELSVRDKIKSQPGCWMQLLYGVHKHHPKMSSLFTFRIFSSAWDSMDSLTVKKLEMLLSHVSGSEASEDPTFDRHASAFILDMLNSPDAEVQEYSLRIAEKLLHKLDNEKLRIVVKEAVRLQRSVHSSVRKWVYEIGKKLYGKTPDDVFRDCKVILLRGLSDGVKELEESCLEFWRGVLDSTSPEKALPQILSNMYSSDTEDVFLSNATRVLLHLVDDEYSKRKELFPHPITHRCKFRKRNLVVGLRQGFLLSLASTGRSLANQSLENVATIRHCNLPYLRPTISTLQFQPTVQEEEEVESIVNQTFENSTVPTNPFKRRFYKSEAKTSFSFARWQNKNKKQADGVIGKRDAEVDILGEYRDGDYPDIQIRHSQVTKLLETLSRRDHQTARLFLVSFYSGLIKAVGTEQREALFNETRHHFENILKSSGNFDPGVFGFILQVILHHSRKLDIDFQLVSNAAVSSNWISLGALIIEQIIANKDGEEEKSSKKRKGCERPEEKRWLELAKLYRSLEEFDAVSGIFLDKLDVSGNAKEAIKCESVWDWAGASRHYELVLRSSPEGSQTEFYTESYLSCFAKLSNWSVLNKCIRTTVNNDLGELWNNYYLLAWFLRSEMMISLGTDRNEFQTIIEEFCKNSVKRDILAVNFGEEMTVFDWFSNNLQRAHHRIDKLCLDFLAGWSHLDQWSYNLRAAKLTSLQTLAELSFALRNLSEASRSQVEQNIEEGVKRWEKNVPSAGDELTVWDIKLGYRREFFNRLKDFDLTAMDVKANLALAKAALSQENLNLTKECLTRAKGRLPEGDYDLKAEHDICFNMGKMVVAKLKMKEPSVGLEVYLNVWKGISKQASTAMETDSESKTLLYTCNFTLGQLVAEILPFVKSQTVPQEILKSLCQKLKVPERNVPTALHEKGLGYFEAAISALEDSNFSAETKSNAYLELSKFLLKFSDSGQFEKLCGHLLKAMRLGNPDARELFGCLLNMSHLLTDESSFEDVIAECERVPSWMFLMWINQMFARLDSSLYDFLRPLLLRITHDYPNAVRYPLKLMEEVKFQLKIKSYLSRLSMLLLKDKLYDDFWKAVRYLTPPDLIVSHYLQDALEEASQIKPDYSKIKKLVSNLQEIMFSAAYEKFRGPVFKIWETLEDSLEALLTGFENPEVLKRKIRSLLSSVENMRMPSKRALSLLESYSPWLHNFHALKMDSTLELPGQYDGRRQPIKKYLVLVSSFRNSVVVFDSKCRPMRIGILGNDAKEHKFLVKFGEDLRQDERIQQVFRHFNHRLTESKQTGRFRLDTYKVIPLRPDQGMIEWVEDTVSLYDIIQNALGNDSETIVKAQTAHLAFLSQGSPLALPGSLRGALAAHLIAYDSIKRENAISSFRATVQLFPQDLLKKSFVDLSTSPEHFMHLRANFSTSHAIVCITHWLVGIGDRHLQNTLVSTKTGRVLGIDFGYAFGFATQFLTPPELLPFRLSPQILNLMHPLDESGWIKQTMIHCLRVFRKESFRLRSVLEVFAEEPVLNWLKQVKKNPNYRAENDTWYPREKLSLVERKLSGVNPVKAFESDLLAGHSQSKYLNKYLEVLKGVPRDNVRARCREDGLTEEEQVGCLIDLATDPHVLAKTYVGWNPWL